MHVASASQSTWKLKPSCWQFWAVYVDCGSQYKDAVKLSLDQVDTVKKFIRKYPDVFKFVTTAQGQYRACAQFKHNSEILAM